MIDSSNWYKFYMHEESDYSSVEALRIGANILATQRLHGGWGKKLNVTEVYEDLAAKRDYELQLEQNYDVAVLENYSHKSAGFDEGETPLYARYLLRIANSTQDQIYVDAAKLGVDYVLSAQYPSGGWPQTYPMLVGYGAYVTFNDKAMTEAIKLSKDLADNDYISIDEFTKLAAINSLERGVDYLLKSQIKINAVLTGWCAQHDHGTYAPLGARAYELPSVGGVASVDVVKFLMSISNPSCKLVSAVYGCLNWLESNQISEKAWVKAYDKGLNRAVTIQIKEDPGSSNDPKDYTYTEAGYDKKLVESIDSDPQLWARFYDLTTGEPLFSNWDGLPQRSVDLIDYSLRINYSWYGSWAKTVIDSSSWKSAHPESH